MGFEIEIEPALSKGKDVIGLIFVRKCLIQVHILWGFGAHTSLNSLK